MQQYVEENLTQNQAENDPNQNPEKQKKTVCFMSIISFIIGLLSFGAYYLVLEYRMRDFIPIWVVLGIVSTFLPTIAKYIRTLRGQSGKGFEIAAIVIGGYVFYTIIFSLTEMDIFVGYLGWIGGGLIYKYSKKE